jgi:Spy/CpxP family protein refolding chaperone
MIHQVKLLRRLDLTDEQKEAVKAVLATDHESVAEQVGKLSELHRDLEAAIEAAADAATLRAKAAALGTLYGEVAVVRSSLLARLNALLTDEQKRKALALRHEDEARSAEQQERIRAALKERVEKGGAVSVLDLLGR